MDKESTFHNIRNRLYLQRNGEKWRLQNRSIVVQNNKLMTNKLLEALVVNSFGLDKEDILKNVLIRMHQSGHNTI